MMEKKKREERTESSERAFDTRIEKKKNEWEGWQLGSGDCRSLSEDLGILSASGLMCTGKG
jgi:hypothetical protein